MAEGDGGNSTRVARAILGDGRLENLEVIFTAEPLVDSTYHFGSRLAFDPRATCLSPVSAGRASAPRTSATTTAR